MSIEDTMVFLAEGEICGVCGKGLKAGEALAAAYEGESRLPICCPLCLAAYQEDPKPYLKRMAQRMSLRELRRPSGEEFREGRLNG